MNLLETGNNLNFQKAMSVLVAVLFSLNAILGLCRPGSIPVMVDGGNKLAYYGPLWGELAIGLAAAMLFRWLHQRVRRVVASESGLRIMAEPARTLIWPEVKSVSKALPNMMSGFYWVSLVDGTDFYAPIEREPPTFSTLRTWADAPSVLEQLCRKKGVWVE